MCLFDSDTYNVSYVCMFGLCPCVCLIVMLKVYRMCVCVWFVYMCLFDSDAYSVSYVCMFGLCPCVCLIVMLTTYRMFVCLVCVHVFVW